MNTVIAVLEIASFVALVSVVSVAVVIGVTFNQAISSSVGRAARKATAFEPWNHDTSLANAHR